LILKAPVFYKIGAFFLGKVFMKYNDMLLGYFLKRENRFTVIIDLDGRAVRAHLANSGRLRELLVPGQRAGVVYRPSP